MRNRKNKRPHLKHCLLGCCLCLGILCLIHNPHDLIQAVLGVMPPGSVWAAVIFLLLYAAKSATVVFPLVLLEIAVGHWFPPWAALGVNLLGILIILSVPYWIGYAAGEDVVDKLIKKHPKFGVLVSKQQDNSFFLCFFLRVISCLPGDIVTMYLGATHTPFWKNIVAGTLGIAPGMVLATLLGSSIQNPRSPAFWLSALLMIALAALSVVFYSLYRRRLQKRNPPDRPKDHRAP